MKRILKILILPFWLSIVIFLTNSCSKEETPAPDVSVTAPPVDPQTNIITVVATDRVSTTTTPTTGWASVTGYRNATTNVQVNVVALALAASGKSAGQSVTNTAYYTDCYNGDGGRMRSAINDYHVWYSAHTPANKCSTPSVPTTVITSMKNRLSATYNANEQTAMVNQIITKYNAWMCANPNASIAIPTDDNQTLAFLAIRKQCMEWARFIASSAGGTPCGYNAPAVAEADYRPGMGFYKWSPSNKQHAMLITDIYWTVTKNAQGVVTSIKATSFRVAESNYASQWVNPPGQVPWLRVIATGRIETMSTEKKVVTYG